MGFFGQHDDGGTALAKVGVYTGIAAAGVAALAIGVGSFFTYIPPNERAVKQSKYGEGIEQKVYEGGEYYFENFGVSFLRFPKNWQVLDFNDTPIDSEDQEI